MKQPAATIEIGRRQSLCHGLCQIVRFNWPRYVVAFACIALATLFLEAVAPPRLLHFSVLLGIFAAAWWVLASLIASFWIYDVSHLTHWAWLRTHLTAGDRQRVLNIHSGFDDTTWRLLHVFPEAQITAVDLYNPTQMTEPSIDRARHSMSRLAGTLSGRADRLPIDTASVDAIFLLLAAHELRRPAERESLFTEAARVLKRGGRVVLTEHARDGWNFLAFGPGFMHFLPYGEWLRLARHAQFNVVCETRVTPFIRVLVLQKN